VFKTTQFLALVALFSVATAASADEASWAREANDRAEIQAVMWTFSRALEGLAPGDSVVTRESNCGTASDQTPSFASAAAHRNGGLQSLPGENLRRTRSVLVLSDNLL